MMNKITTFVKIVLIISILALVSRVVHTSKNDNVHSKYALIENEADIENPREKRFIDILFQNGIDFMKSVPKMVKGFVIAPIRTFQGSPRFVVETATDTLFRKCNILHPDFNCFGIKDHTKEKCGMIILQGLGFKAPSELTAKFTSKLLLGLRRNCEVLAPTAPSRPTDRVPMATLMSRMGGIGNLNPFRSWFNFKELPEYLIESYDPSDESKEDLDDSLELVEGYIEKLARKGVPLKNIVLMGFSQGGAMTIYTAIHTKYKIGGFIPVIAWMPRRLVEPITQLPIPTNWDTPILQINGMTDAIVKYYPAGQKTAEDMQKVFTKYRMKRMSLGNHATTVLSFDFLNVVKDWLKRNTEITS